MTFSAYAGACDPQWNWSAWARCLNPCSPRPDRQAGGAPVTVFCVHDADAYGTMIYQTLQQETKARGARKIEIINWGLEPDDAEGDGLEVEKVEEKDKRKPVADYALEWEQWLQTKRVELNAMTPPRSIEWLDSKMAHYDKLIPPGEVLEAELTERIEAKVRAAVTERILREAGIEDQVVPPLPPSSFRAFDIKMDFAKGSRH